MVGTQFTKSVIRSRAALTYAEAQSRIDDERLTDELSVSERGGGGGVGWGGGGLWRVHARAHASVWRGHGMP